MKKILLAVTAVVAIGVAMPVALGASPLAPSIANGNKLTCFDGTTDGAYGLCTVNKAGIATLDNESNDETGTMNPFDQYSGVYVKNSNLVGKTIGTVNQLGFSYRGDPATAGSPRISLGIDTDGDGDRDVFAFISAFYCNDGVGNVDVIKDPTCTIYAGDAVYENWAAMVAAHPEYRVGYTPFVIADDQGEWTVFNVKLGKGPAGGPKN